ncbi:uncharacterized protein PgNI_02712 [Pyricularia grisea]|uniref:Cyclin N-terminal domain-containing protein n=1 Tax=Pyricularia grisea TaxID=148305 RepID=A0A6P8BC54_PYRGI|nr:uncharacterized protein PgNI_02712 [Pyricularia grisea]TLD13436.1 hypothetical protein PgNI_02712 [Pyricularia grisea]
MSINYCKSSKFSNPSNNALNATALRAFVNSPIIWETIKYFAVRTSEVIVCENDKRTNISVESRISDFERFIANLVWHSKVRVATLMFFLVYLNRLKTRFQNCIGHLNTPYRLFLVNLILTAKYLNDKLPWNKEWAKYVFLRAVDANGDNLGYGFHFSIAGVNEMERQLFDLLSWDLKIENSDLYYELEIFLKPIRFKISEKAIKKGRWWIHGRSNTTIPSNCRVALKKLSII